MKLHSCKYIIHTTDIYFVIVPTNMSDCALSPTCFISNLRWNVMYYYTKVYFNIIPTIHKKYRKQNKQPKRKLVRQIILEINSLDM